MFFRILEIVAPIVFIVGVAYGYGRYKKPTMEAANTVNLDVFIPALVIAVFARQEMNIAEYADLLKVGVLVTLLPALLTLTCYRWFHVQWKTLALPMMFKNSGNLGIPLLLFTFGESYLPAIILLFIVSTLLHVTVGIWMLSNTQRSFGFLKQPILLATLLGVLMSVFGVDLPEWLVTGLTLLGDVAVPLMLFSLGVRLVDLDVHGWRIGVLGALAAPLFGLVSAALGLLLFNLPETQEKMIWLYAALPPAVMNFILAERYQQQPAKMAAIVLFANAGSLVIIPAVLFVIL